MKKILFPFIFLFVLNTAFAQNPDAYASFAVFNTPSNEPYIESYIAINPNSLMKKKQNAELQTGAEVTIIIKQGEKIVNFDKFDLLAQPQKDSFYVNNLMAQRRIAVPQGNYIYEVSVKDLNNQKAVTVLAPQSVSVDFNNEGVTISDIQFSEPFEKTDDTKNPMYKNGFLVKPLIMNYYPTKETSINYYAEVYNGKDKLDQDIVILSSIRKKGDTKPAPGFQVFSKQKSSKVNVVMGQIKIKELPTGYYDFVIEVRDRQNNLRAQKVHTFQRSNKEVIEGMDNIMLVDVSNTFVESLSQEATIKNLKMVKPIATNGENDMIKQLIEESDSLNMKRYLFNFWLARNEKDPELSWKKYMVFIKVVEENFSTVNRPGYETDRGRVYLQYGPPSDIMEGNYESGSQPYEIWQYNRLDNGETNRVFVFYNPDLVSNTYKLLHSDVTGEIRNEDWKSILYNNSIGPSQDGTFDAIDRRDNFGTKKVDPIKGN